MSEEHTAACRGVHATTSLPHPPSVFTEVLYKAGESWKTSYGLKANPSVERGDGNDIPKWWEKQPFISAGTVTRIKWQDKCLCFFWFPSALARPQLVCRGDLSPAERGTNLRRGKRQCSKNEWFEPNKGLKKARSVEGMVSWSTQRIKRECVALESDRMQTMQRQQLQWSTCCYKHQAQHPILVLSCKLGGTHHTGITLSINHISGSSHSNLFPCLWRK